MKPIKILKERCYRYDGDYIHISYQTQYSKGRYVIAEDLYLVNKKKFDKVMKDCTILKIERV